MGVEHLVERRNERTHLTFYPEDVLSEAVFDLFELRPDLLIFCGYCIYLGLQSTVGEGGETE